MFTTTAHANPSRRWTQKLAAPSNPPEWEQSPSDETLHPHAYSRFSAETWVIWR
ncbi:MAG: hypothetical protein ABSF59_19845 [Candidatus Sulfotelmatobacter sp.]